MGEWMAGWIKVEIRLISALIDIEIKLSWDLTWQKSNLRNSRNHFQEQERKDGFTADGKPATAPSDNREGQNCAKCGEVGESLQVCGVNFLQVKLYNCL